MDFKNLQADKNMILTRHFTKGRSGAKINKVILHHNAGNLTIEDCYRVWQSREASAHYQVESSGRIGQLVNDWDTAWHAGNWNANISSIGIEHADCSSSPWLISDACLESGAHLVAAICLYYNLGRPQWMVNVFPHSYFSPTACPASIAGSQNAAYMKRAGEWYDAMKSGGNAPAQKPSTPQPPTQPSKPSGNGKDLGAVTVRYGLHTKNGGWLDEVVNFNNTNDNGYAGVPNGEHDYLYIKVDKGSVKYRVHTVGGGWLPWVTKGDKNDLVNGCAGIAGRAIDGVQIYYTTPDGYNYQQAWYRSQTTHRAGWLGVCCDDGNSASGYDGWAGMLGEPTDRLQIKIGDRNPF